MLNEKETQSPLGGIGKEITLKKGAAIYIYLEPKQASGIKSHIKRFAYILDIPIFQLLATLLTSLF